MSVVAQSDIKAGEQITICYLDGEYAFQAAAMRQRELSAKSCGVAWSCQCQTCTATLPAIRESDERRLSLASTRERFIEHGNRRDLAILLQTMAHEGLTMSLMGTDCLLKMVHCMERFDANFADAAARIHAETFRIGVKVCVINLEENSALNGRMGTVQEAFCPESGRVGVLLDISTTTAQPTMDIDLAVALMPQNMRHIQSSWQ